MGHTFYCSQLKIQNDVTIIRVSYYLLLHLFEAFICPCLFSNALNYRPSLQSFIRYNNSVIVNLVIIFVGTFIICLLKLQTG